MKILVSACLLGKNCKYNGGNNLDRRVVEFLQGHEVIPVCPERAAGLGIPRTPVEIVNGEVKDRFGNSVDSALRAAVAEILAENRDADYAVLKSRSPTCGVREVYDGTFSGVKVPGMGILAQALHDAGMKVIDSEDV